MADDIKRAICNNYKTASVHQGAVIRDTVYYCDDKIVQEDRKYHHYEKKRLLFYGHLKRMNSVI